MLLTTPALFVATDLMHVEIDAAALPSPDLVRDGRTYRRLDPPYFAWLYQAMSRAELAAANDQLEPTTYQELRCRFNAIYFWAVRHLGRTRLQQVVAGADIGYQPPPSPTTPVRPKRKAQEGPPQAHPAQQTEIGGRWASGAGRLRLGGQEHPFRPWSPALGSVYRKGFAFDSETTLIQGHMTPDFVLGAVYGDTGHGYFLTPDVVEPFFRLHGDLPMAMHNAEFDLRVLDRLAPMLRVYDWVDACRVWDTRLLHRGYRLAIIGDTAAGKDQSTLETCAREYLGVYIPKDVQDSQGHTVRMSYERWLGQPLAAIEDVYLTYLATDVVVTLQVFRTVYDRLIRLLRGSGTTWGFVSQEWLERCITRWGPQTHHLRLQAEIVLKQVSCRGVLVAGPQRNSARRAVQQVIDDQLDVLARNFNYRPGAQVRVATADGDRLVGPAKRLQQILADLAGEVPDLRLERTPTGDYRATREVVEELADYSPFFAHLQEYRTAAKLQATYLDKMGSDAGPTVLHPSYDVLKATGRTSSFGAINAQNLPRKDQRIRRCFVPRPGHVFLDFDYKAVELAALAQAVLRQFGLPSRMAEAINAGEDLHRLLAARIFQLPEDQVNDERRGAAKPANFGLPVGMSAPRFRAYFRTHIKHDGKLTTAQKAELEAWATLENCQQAIDAWFTTWPEMRSFLEKDQDLLYRLAEFCELTPEHYHLFTGRWVRNDAYREPADWLGGMLLKTIKTEGVPCKQDGAEYAPDQIAFLWTMLERKREHLPVQAQTLIRKRQAGYALFQAVRNHVSQAAVFCLTGRLRAKTSYCSRHNTVFQGLASDGACRALWALWRAGYTISNFVHDQIVVELAADHDLRPHVLRIQELMRQAMREVVPDVRIDVDAVVTTSWAKQDRVALDDDGRPVVLPPT